MKIGDQVEEALLRKHDAVQAALNGMWQELLGGCPHLHRGDINLCDARKMTPCVYETSDGPCELFQGILDEWAKELEICGQMKETMSQMASQVDFEEAASEYCREQGWGEPS